jgi:hypothetical protein
MVNDKLRNRGDCPAAAPQLLIPPAYRRGATNKKISRSRSWDKAVDADRVLTLSFNFPPTVWRSSGFMAPLNVNEFDVIVWDARLSIVELQLHAKEVAVRTFRSNLAKLIEWVSLGHTLIVIVAPFFESVRYPANNQLAEFRLDRYEPFEGMSLEQSAGQLVEFCGPEFLRNLLEPSLAKLEYSVIIQSNTLKPLFKVSQGRFGSQQIVGGYKRVGSGFVFFAPPWRGGPFTDGFTNYLSNLAAVPELLTANSPGKLPWWAEAYRTEGEEAALEQMARLEAEIAAIRQGVEEQQRLVEADRYLKQLFAGTADAFTASVAEVFREFGLNITEGPSGRADLIGYDGTHLFAFEVKGLEGVARERNLRQAEQWVADIRSALTATDEQKAADKDLGRYAEKLRELGVPSDQEIDCKGVMVIGTYRKTPVSERTDTGFPDPVARPLARSNVCALSGLQLLGLLLNKRKGNELGPQILTRMYGTNGVLQEALDWQSFLMVSGAASQ